MRYFIPFLLVLFTIASSVFAQAEKLYTRINWPRLQSFPESFSFEGEISGYISVFSIEGGWHVYIYRSREELLEHNATSFVKLDDIEFRNILGIQNFAGNEKLLKSLDQRFVRIAGLFRTAEYTISEVPYFAYKISLLSWRGKDGEWTSDQKEGLDGSPLKAGRQLIFPKGVFFKHEN